MENLEQEYITIKQASQIIGVSYTEIWSWIDLKIIPAYKMGTIWRLNKKEFLQDFRSGKFQEKYLELKKGKEKENINNNPESGAASSPPFASPPSGENKKEE